MNKDDIAEVLKIENQVFTHSSWNYKAFEYELSSPISYPYVIVINDVLIGYIIFHIIEPETHITNFAIKKEQQDKGYGKYLLNFAIEKIKKSNVKSIFLEVRSSNLKAQHIYEKFGFKKLGVRKGYYKNNNEDAIVMGLFL